MAGFWKLEKPRKQILPESPQKEPACQRLDFSSPLFKCPAVTRFQISSFQKSKRQICAVLSHHVCDHLLQRPRERNTRGDIKQVGPLHKRICPVAETPDSDASLDFPSVTKALLNSILNILHSLHVFKTFSNDLRRQSGRKGIR